MVDSPFLPAQGGGEQEHFGILRAAARTGVLALVVMPASGAVDLAPYRDALGDVPFLLTPRRTSPLRLLHPRDPYVVASRPAPSWLTSRAQELAPDADAVLTTSYKSWRIGRRLAHDLGLPMALRHHNREGDYHRSLADGMRGPRRWVMSWEALRVRRDERRVDSAPWLAGIADISEADADARRRAGARAVLHVPPFVLRVDTGQDPPVRSPAEPQRVLFLGALDVPTNTSALDWLLEHVWPVVRAAAPDAVLDVVGRRPSPALQQRLRAADGVHLHADVPDLAPLLARASVAVNPAVTGSGVNIKVVDYLDAGLPVVSTSLATRGLPLRAGVDLEVADRPEDFAGAIVALLSDRGRAVSMGLDGRRTMRELLDPDANIALLSQLLGGGVTRALASGPPAPDPGGPARGGHSS